MFSKAASSMSRWGRPGSRRPAASRPGARPRQVRQPQALVLEDQVPARGLGQADEVADLLEDGGGSNGFLRYSSARALSRLWLSKPSASLPVMITGILLELVVLLELAQMM
jgi:hypothetical protein